MARLRVHADRGEHPRHVDGRRAPSLTLGAWRRQTGIDDRDVRRKVLWMLACEMVAELRRQAAVEEWAAIGRCLSTGWPPHQIAARMRRLADRLDPPPDQEAA